MDTHLLTLLKEYVDVVDAMGSGQYTTEETRTLDSERILLHDRILEITGLTRETDMYRHARDEMHRARALGYLRDTDY